MERGGCTVCSAGCVGSAAQTASARAASKGGRPYGRRITDDVLDELLPQLPAIAVEGPKVVGKTRTGAERARTVRRLDDRNEVELVEADPGRLRTGERPILIDEWQGYPSSYDIVRHAVDDDRTPGRLRDPPLGLPGAPGAHRPGAPAGRTGRSSRGTSTGSSTRTSPSSVPRSASRGRSGDRGCGTVVQLAAE